MRGLLDREWRRVVVVASGPSLNAEQIDQIEQARAEGLVRVLAINTTAFALLNADAMYAADVRWWLEYGARMRAEFRGEQWAPARGRNEVTDPQRARYAQIVESNGIREVVLDRSEGISKTPGAVCYGGNGGYQSIGLAYQFGACCIVLAGFDLQRTGGRSHHHGDHPKSLHNAPDAAFKDWAPRFTRLADDLDAAGVGVVNCSGETALTQWPRATLAEVFDCFRANP